MHFMAFPSSGSYCESTNVSGSAGPGYPDHYLSNMEKMVDNKDHGNKIRIDECPYSFEFVVYMNGCMHLSRCCSYQTSGTQFMDLFAFLPINPSIYLGSYIPAISAPQAPPLQPAHVPFPGFVSPKYTARHGEDVQPVGQGQSFSLEDAL